MHASWCTTAGVKGKKKAEVVIDLLDEEDDADDNGSQLMRSSPQPVSAPRVTHHLLPSPPLNAHMHSQCSCSMTPGVAELAV